MQDRTSRGIGGWRLLALAVIGGLLFYQAEYRFQAGWSGPEQASFSLAELIADTWHSLGFVVAVTLLLGAYVHGLTGLRAAVRFLSARRPRESIQGASELFATMGRTAMFAGVLYGLFEVMAPYFRMQYDVWPSDPSGQRGISSYLPGPMFGLIVGGVLLRSLACAARRSEGTTARARAGSAAPGEASSYLALIGAVACLALIYRWLFFTIPTNY